jgi:DNA-binding ferritin-like protein
MTDETKRAWNDVGERFSSLGKRLADNYNANDKTATSAKETQHKVEEVVRDIGNQLGRALEALDETVRDDDARKDLKGAISARGTAISSSVDEAAGAIRGGAGKPGEEPPRPDAEE